RIQTLDRVRLVAPTRIAIRFGIESLRDEIARRSPEAATLVETPQSALQRRLGDLLHVQVERRVDFQSAFVEVLDAERRVALDVLPDLFREVRADARCLVFVRAEDDRRVDGALIFGGGD